MNVPPPYGGGTFIPVPAFAGINSSGDPPRMFSRGNSCRKKIKTSDLYRGFSRERDKVVLTAAESRCPGIHFKLPKVVLRKTIFGVAESNGFIETGEEKIIVRVDRV
jgi:hypothetical protein